MCRITAAFAVCGTDLKGWFGSYGLAYQIKAACEIKVNPVFLEVMVIARYKKHLADWAFNQYLAGYVQMSQVDGVKAPAQNSRAVL
jgi:hypothetical protein